MQVEVEERKQNKCYYMLRGNINMNKIIQKTMPQYYYSNTIQTKRCQTESQ